MAGAVAVYGLGMFVLESSFEILKSFHVFDSQFFGAANTPIRAHLAICARGYKISRKNRLALLFVPGQALSHHLYFAAAAVRFHEDCELSVSAFPL